MARIFYADTLTVPAATSWDAPEELVFPLPTGTIVEWYVQGAPEHQHQVAIAIYHLAHRIFPEGEGEYFYPCEIPAIFSVEAKMTPGVPHVAILGTNTDPYWPHSVYVGITVETGVIPMRLLERVMSLMLGQPVEA